MTQVTLIRDATEADLPAIRDIYNHAVEHTTAIWNETVVDLDNRREWPAMRRASLLPGSGRREGRQDRRLRLLRRLARLRRLPSHGRAFGLRRKGLPAGAGIASN